MEDFKTTLENIEDSYYGFVAAVITYVQKKQSRFDAVSSFIINNPKALSSDILQFITNQPDFFEDAAKQYAPIDNAI